ncbi:evC complex member EVC-like isoform X2 [Narcine bancroftii]
MVEERTKAAASAHQKEDEISINSNIAAFALKARVIYPINQKFRPLADGSSNPSLLENLKLRDCSKIMKEDFILSGEKSSGQMDGRGSYYFSGNYSPLDPETCHEDKAILMVTFFPEILVQSSSGADLALFRLALQDLRQLHSEIYQEKYTMFLQLLRIELNDLYLREKIDENFYRDFISVQEKELKEQVKKNQTMWPSVPARKDPEHYTLEGTEKDEYDHFQFAKQQLSGFFQQAEHSHLFLRKHAELPEDMLEEIKQNMCEKMSQVENLLTDILTLQVTVILDKLLHRKYMAKSLHFLKWLDQQENRDKLKVASSALDALIRDGKLASWQKEELTDRLQNSIQSCVNTVNNEYTHQAKGIILRMRRQRRFLLKRLEEAQQQEAMNLTDKARQIFAPDHFIKSYHELEDRHRRIRREVEDEEDHKDTEAFTELWKNLHCASSQTVDKLVEEFFTETLSNITEVSSFAMETLRNQMQQELTARKQASTEERKCHLTLFQEKLDQLKQEWIKEQALNSAKQKHLVEYKKQIIQNFLLYQTTLDEKISRHIVLEHRTALQSVVRQLTMRHLSLMTLKEMKLYETKRQMEELREEQLKEPPIWDEHEDESKILRDNLVTRLSKEKEKQCQEAESLLQQQLTAESQSLMELLQDHMTQVIGCALVHQAQVIPAKQNLKDPTENLKNLLVERATESVYVTMENATGLIQNYYRQIEEITEQYRKDERNQLRSLQETFKRKQVMKERMIEENLNADMVNVKAKRFTTTRIQHQMMLQQKKIMSLLLLEEEMKIEFLKQKTELLHQLKEQLDKHLKMTEETFMSQLSSLARVSQAEFKALDQLW